MIQFISTKKCDENNDAIVSDFVKYRSFEDFEVNIIDLNSEDIWNNLSKQQNIAKESDTIANINNISNIAKSLEHTQSKVIFILPQDIKFNWTYYNETKGVNLRNRIAVVYKILKILLNTGLQLFEIYYSVTNTSVKNKNHKSDFVFSKFNNYHWNVLTSSLSGKQPTSIISSNKQIIITTLEFVNLNEILDYVYETSIIESKNSSEPEWLAQIKILDDIDLESKISELKLEVQRMDLQINEASDKLEKNKRYKSILYSNGNELTTIVFEILSEIFDLELHKFADRKKEDFKFEYNNIVFIGEVKGVTSNVKLIHLSQLDFHYYNFLESNLNVKSENVRKLLIINHQRDKNIIERDPVDKIQIDYAKNKYNSLIIETTVLIRIYEKYLKNEFNKLDVIELLENKTGILLL